METTVHETKQHVRWKSNTLHRCENGWKCVFTDRLYWLINHKGHLPVLARLLPKLKTVPVVVAVPKHPTLKLTAAGLAFKPNPPKLNPPAVVFPAPSPPNPAASRGRQRERENDMKELKWKKVRASMGSLIVKTVFKYLKRDGTNKRYKATCFTEHVSLTSVGGAKTKSCGWCSSSGGGCPKTRGCESYEEKSRHKIGTQLNWHTN